MSVKFGLFLQALATFILGLYLASMGLPSETDLITDAGEQIMDVLDDVSDSQEVHNIAENTKSSFRMLGFFMIIFSILELIALGISAFK